jgi:hypothetical protein
LKKLTVLNNPRIFSIKKYISYCPSTSSFWRCSSFRILMLSDFQLGPLVWGKHSRTISTTLTRPNVCSFSKLMHKIMLNFGILYLCNQALNQKMLKLKNAHFICLIPDKPLLTSNLRPQQEFCQRSLCPVIPWGEGGAGCRQVSLRVLLSLVCGRGEGSSCTFGISLQTRGPEPSPLALFLYCYSLFICPMRQISSLTTALL